MSRQNNYQRNYGKIYSSSHEDMGCMGTYRWKDLRRTYWSIHLEPDNTKMKLVKHHLQRQDIVAYICISSTHLCMRTTHHPSKLIQCFTFIIRTVHHEFLSTRDIFVITRRIYFDELENFYVLRISIIFSTRRSLTKGSP